MNSQPNPSPIHRLTGAVDRVLGVLVAALMGLLVLDVLWQVFTRFVLDDPSAFTDELARFLLIWVGLLGAAYVAGQKMHLAIDLLPTYITGRKRYLLGAVIEAVVIVFAVSVLVVGGARLVGLTLMMGQTSAALGLKLGYVYAVLPLSGILISFYAAVFMAEYLRALGGDEEAREEAPEVVPHVTTTTTQYE